MKPLYIESYGDIRRDRATADEIRAFAAGKNADRERLVRIEVDKEGEMIPRAVSAPELSAIALEVDAAQAVMFAALLDDTLRYIRAATQIGGVTFLSTALQVEADAAPFAEKLILDWAERNGLDIEHSSPPTTPRKWKPELRVRLKYRAIVELVYPYREANTDAAIAEESDLVVAERRAAEADLAAIAEAF